MTVGSTHRHSQRADAGLVYELRGILHLGVILGNTLGGLADFAQLALDADAHFRGHLHNALGDCNVLFQGLSGSVDHNARRAVAERPQNLGNTRAVIQMEGTGVFMLFMASRIMGATYWATWESNRRLYIWKMTGAPVSSAAA